MKKINARTFLQSVYDAQEDIKKDFHLSKKMDWLPRLIGDWKNKTGVIPYHRCVEIAEKLNLDLNELLTGDKKEFKIPIYGDVVVSAGSGGSVISEQPTGYLDLTEKKILKVVGDSMEPNINNGDYVIYEDYEELEPNKTYVVRYGSNIYVKTVKFENQKYILQSYNVEYEDIIVNRNEDFELIGLVKMTIALT